MPDDSPNRITLVPRTLASTRGFLVYHDNLAIGWLGHEVGATEEDIRHLAEAKVAELRLAADLRGELLSYVEGAEAPIPAAALAVLACVDEDVVLVEMAALIASGKVQLADGGCYARRGA